MSFSCKNFSKQNCLRIVSRQFFFESSFVAFSKVLVAKNLFFGTIFIRILPNLFQKKIKKLLLSKWFVISDSNSIDFRNFGEILLKVSELKLYWSIKVILYVNNNKINGGYA